MIVVYHFVFEVHNLTADPIMASDPKQDNSGLPIIDMSAPNRLETARMLIKAMETIGFVYLDNIPGYNQDKERELLEIAQQFFSLPLKDKLQYSPKRWNKEGKGGLYKGYTPFCAKYPLEFFLMGESVPENDRIENVLHESTPMPSPDTTFYKVMNSHFSCMFNTAMEILRLTALGLGLDEHIFDDRFIPRSLSTLKLLRYPPLDEGVSLPSFRTNDHTDASFITLLVTFEYEGLEYFSSEGTWLKVASRPGSVIMNIGMLLSQLSNNRIRATRHRVQDIVGKDRISVPFFLEAHSDAKFEIPGSGSLIYGPWMAKMISRAYAFQQLADIEF